MLKQNYEDLYEFSISNLEEFWDEIAKEVVWSKPYTHVLENKFSHSPKWFVNGEINMSYNCLDKHVEDGYGNDVAVIHDSPITGSTQSLTYNQLLQSVSLLAGVMVDRCGIKMGDIVLLYFPVIPECLISMLACTRIGATYVVVFGGFSTKELSVRIRHTEPKLVLTCNVGPESDHFLYYKKKLDDAVIICGFSPTYCLVYNRPNFQRATMRDGIDLDWATELLTAKAHDPVPIDSNHPMFIIYTSGTTGHPKGLVHLTGSSVVINKFASKCMYNFYPNQTIFTLSTFGWILGQSIMSFGALLTRVKTVLFEGSIVGTRGDSQFARVLNWHKVTHVICPPTVMRILQKTCSKSELELNYEGLSSIFIGGEVSDSNIRKWSSATFGCEIVNIWGQTELNGIIGASRMSSIAIVDNTYILKPFGLDIIIMDKKTGLELPRGCSGSIVIKLPLFPSMASTLYKNEGNFKKVYFERYPGYYDTMDAGFITEEGWIKVECRDDDVIHVAAARISGSAVEEACLQNSDISEVVVIPLEDDLLGNVPFAFLVRKENDNKSDQDVIDDTINLVMDIIGNVACFKKAVIIDELPKTINGKLHRASLVAMIHGRIYTIPGVVVNSHVYPPIYDSLVRSGYNASLPEYST